MPNKRLFGISVSALLLLSACRQEREDFKALSRVPREQWVSFAERLPIERRLALYREVYEQSYPGDTILAHSFQQDPEPSFEATLRRLQESRQGEAASYLNIIIDIQESTPFKICGTPRMQRLESALAKKSFDREQRKAFASWQIGKCPVIISG